MRAIGSGAEAFPTKISITADWLPAAIVSLIGLLLTLNVMLWFPDWAATIAQLNSF